jgi:hypothetical protein
MIDLSSTEQFLLASDNQLGDIWARHYIDGAYPEAIEDWCGARKFFHDAYVAYREQQCLGDQPFRVPLIIPPGSESYRKNVVNALGAGQVVLDSEWIFEGVRVRVPVLEKTSNGFNATLIRSSKTYSRSGTKHDALERGLVALALQENGIAPLSVFSTRTLNIEGAGGFSHTFKVAQQVGEQSEASLVRAELAKLQEVLADPLTPPESGEYCALLDDAGLCCSDALLKRVSSHTGADWRSLSDAQALVVTRLARCLQENRVQMSGDFCQKQSFLCFSVDVMPIRSLLLNPVNGQGQMAVTPRAMAAAWNEHGQIAKMFFRLDDLCADSQKIAELKAKAGPFEKRASFVECGNVHGASRLHQWFRRRFGIEHTKSLDSFYTNRNGCVHPELVRNGFTLESWSKAFLGEEIASLSSRFPLQRRLQIWAGAVHGAELDQLDGILSSRAALFARSMLAVAKHLSKCQTKGLMREVQNPRFFEMPVPVPVSLSGKERLKNPSAGEELLLF